MPTGADLETLMPLGLIHKQRARGPLQFWRGWEPAMEHVGGAWLLTQVQVPLGCGWAFILRVAKLLLSEAPFLQS